MSDWIAKTVSGRTYESTLFGVIVSGKGYFPSPAMRSFSPDQVKELFTEEGRVDWSKMNALPLVDRPVVGEHFYLYSFGDAGWRISTLIASVEDV